MLIILLVALVILDWITAWAAGWMQGEAWSRTRLIEGVRKLAIFAVVLIAHLIDAVLGDLHIFRDAVIFFYLANELLSVIENMGKMGVKVPGFLRQAIHIFDARSNTNEHTPEERIEPKAGDDPIKPEELTEIVEESEQRSS